MWLLNCQSRRLDYFIDDRQVVGRYAILSHTWGEDEISFDSIHDPEARKRHGYRKIDYTCKQAAFDGLEFVWIDTCCIDKKSSAELSEAINSMYRWYRDARICYVYLEDVDAIDDEDIMASPGTDTLGKLPAVADNSLIQLSAALKTCRWFTRGWTLQELIAPRRLVSFNSAWNFMAGKDQILDLLSQITNIAGAVLVDSECLRTTSIADILSWAASRKTTREEDRAYSLLGLLDINMPLLYGEGVKAFTRLQEEIFRTWSRADHSILAHCEPNLLAKNLDSFRSPRSIVRKGWIQSWQDKFELSNHDLRFVCLTRSFMVPTYESREQPADAKRIVVALDCALATDTESTIGLVLIQRPHIDDLDDAQNYSAPIYEATGSTMTIHLSELKDFVKQEIAIARHPMLWPVLACKVHISKASCPITASSQAGSWDEDRRILSITPGGQSVIGQQWKHAACSFELQSSGLVPHVIDLYLRRNDRRTYDNPLILSLVLRKGDTSNFLLPLLNRGPYHSSIGHGVGGLRSRSTLVLMRDDRPVLRVFSKLITIGNELLWSLDIRDIVELHADSVQAPQDTGCDPVDVGSLTQSNGEHSKKSTLWERIITHLL